MHAFDVLGDPVRRRILELLSGGEHASGEIVSFVQREFGISQAAVSQHLKVLRDSGFADVRIAGPRRIYTLDPAPLREVDAWLDHFRGFWEHKLEALVTEVARGKKERGDL
jgi:DNA-binding transcriptional ArsR family regulator